MDPKRAVPQENDGLIAKIFVGGVPIDVDNETLAHYFTSYGLVLEATLMIDRNSGRYVSRDYFFYRFCIDPPFFAAPVDTFVFIL